jgi:ABC-type dipeptide/oligopeptide/nickel transport system permease component
VVGAAGLVLLLIELAPGDPIDALGQADALRPVLEAQWGLDQPLVHRWLGGLLDRLRGDWGSSMVVRPGAPVWELIAPALARSALYLITALALAMGQATALAWWTEGRSTRTRTALRAASVLPVFLMAHLLVHGLNETAFGLINAGWIARPAWFALPDQASLVREGLAIALLAWGSGTLSELHLEVEGAVTRIRGSGFVQAAIGRGSPTGPAIRRHLMVEVATIAATRVASLIGGLVIVEKVLMMRGAGALFWDAAIARDHGLAVGLAIIAAATVATAQVAADLLRWSIDPRVRARGLV